MSLHENLKSARVSKGLKQSDVAKELACAATSFTNWESGKVNPPLEQLEKACAIYGISPLDLLDHHPTMNDLYHIVQKPISDRSYEEQVALAFSAEVEGFIDEESSSTSYEEEELIRIYRGLEQPERAIVLKMMRGLCS